MAGSRQWSAAGAAAAVVAVAVGANIPAQRRAALHSHGVLHPWYHLAIFGCIAWLAVRATRSGWVQALLVVGLLVFGGATEFVEYWYHAAALEGNDILLDAAGTLVGAGVAIVLQRRTSARSNGSWE